MNIALIYHKNPYSPTPRGGELSVRAIVEYLQRKGHHFALSDMPSRDIIKNADVVLTWGRPALKTAEVCREVGANLALMVRFWKNICPLPAGDLMARKIDTAFTEEKKLIFETAKAIITNTKYAKQVIERWQPVSKGKVHVSYVPILGEFKDCANTKGKILIVTPEIYGEEWLVRNLSELMPDERFLMVNADCDKFKQLTSFRNVEILGYCNMEKIWPDVKVLLTPIYNNDVCGTRRSTIESLRHGIPVLAADACGMSEKIPAPMIITRNAKPQAWKGRITNINLNYDSYFRMAKRAWMQYDTPTQLAQFEQILLECKK